MSEQRVRMAAYTLKRVHQSRSIRIRVTPAGEVVVTAPHRAKMHLIEEFVTQASDWIEKAQRKAALQKKAYPVLDWQALLLLFKGTLYTIKLADFEEKVVLNQTTLYISPITGLATDVKRTLLLWLKQQAEQHITTRTRVLAQLMDVTPRKIAFRQQTSRWGSCTSEGTVTFNWRLIHFAPAVIDYVIVHELAHLNHLNHSKAFWQFVHRFAPDYKRHVLYLRHQQVMIEK